MEDPSSKYLKIDDAQAVTRLLSPASQTPQFKWDFPPKGKPLLVPLENYAVKVLETGEIWLCEEYEITEELDNETFMGILELLLNLKLDFLLEYLKIYALSSRVGHQQTLKLYSKYTNKTNLRCKINNQGRSYPPPSEMYSLYLQLQSVLKKLYSSSIYTGSGLRTKRILFPFPILSSTAIYLFGKESYKLGLSTVFYYGDESIERFTCPEIPMRERKLHFPEDDFGKTPNSLYQSYMAYSIGAIFVYYSTLKEPAVVQKEQTLMPPPGISESGEEKMEEEPESAGTGKSKIQAVQFVTMEMFDKSGTLKKTNHTQQNPYNSVPTDTRLMEDLNDIIKKMITRRDGTEFFTQDTIKFQESIFTQYLEVFEHTLYYNMATTVEYKKSIEEMIRDNIKNGGFAPDNQMLKFKDMVTTIGKKMDKFTIQGPKSQGPDTFTYTLNIKLDIDKTPTTTGGKDETKQKSVAFEITTLFKKNCIIVKAFIDNLSLSVEFGDDLTHLSSILSHTSPFMSAEMDEQRRIVFRVANTLNSFESFLDPLIHTIDIITITSISIFKKLGECIKQEKFGKIAKTSKQIVREIEHKMSLYMEYKNTRGPATTVIGMIPTPSNTLQKEEAMQIVS
jgi:predicted transcriptional regulator